MSRVSGSGSDAAFGFSKRPGTLAHVADQDRYRRAEELHYGAAVNPARWLARQYFEEFRPYLSDVAADETNAVNDQHGR